MKVVRTIKVETEDFNTVSNFLNYLGDIDEEIWNTIDKEYPRCNNLYIETEAFLDFLQKHLSENDYGG